MSNMKIAAVVALFLSFPLFSIAGNLSYPESRRLVFPISEADSAENIAKNGDRLLAEIASRFEIPEIEYEPKPKPRYWKTGVLSQVNFSQVSLTNWADGGEGSIALSAYVDMKANYAKGDVFWDNRLQLGYGFVQNFDDIYKKSDDKIVLDSKFGYKAVDKLFISAIFSFKTQFTPGFKYPSEDNDSYILESMFMAPGNISLGLGADYKPFDFLSVNFAPVTSNLVVVTEQSLREKYGNAIDQVARFELGAQLKVDFSKNFGDKFSLQTSVTLFSDFLDSPQNIKVNWDLVADLKLSKVFSINLRTNLIYDDKILIDNGDGNLCPRVQFKEALSVGISYTFGRY